MQPVIRYDLLYNNISLTPNVSRKLYILSYVLKKKWFGLYVLLTESSERVHVTVTGLFYLVGKKLYLGRILIWNVLDLSNMIAT